MRLLSAVGLAWTQLWVPKIYACGVPEVCAACELQR